MRDPIDPDDFEDDVPEETASLDDFSAREVCQHLSENPSILYEACVELAEADPNEWAALQTHVSECARLLVRPEAVVDDFDTLELYEQEAAWCAILDIARRRRLPLADLL